MQETDKEFDIYRICEAERWMREAARIVRACETAKNRLAELERGIGHIRAVVYDRIGGKTSMLSGDDAVVEQVARIDAARERYIAAFTEYIEAAVEIDKTLARLDDERFALLLRLYYFDGHTWDEVAKRMAYTQRNVMLIRRKALLALFDLIPGGELPDALE